MQLYADTRGDGERDAVGCRRSGRPLRAGTGGQSDRAGAAGGTLQAGQIRQISETPRRYLAARSAVGAVVDLGQADVRCRHVAGLVDAVPARIERAQLDPQHARGVPDLRA